MRAKQWPKSSFIWWTLKLMETEKSKAFEICLSRAKTLDENRDQKLQFKSVTIEKQLAINGYEINAFFWNMVHSAQHMTCYINKNPHTHAHTELNSQRTNTIGSFYILSCKRRKTFFFSFFLFFFLDSFLSVPRQKCSLLSAYYRLYEWHMHNVQKRAKRMTIKRFWLEPKINY